MKLRFHDFMRAGHVSRWHIVQTIHRQNLAEHLWRVAVIALELYDKIVGVKFNQGENDKEILSLVMGALFHDAPEIRMGDTPTPAKKFIRERAGVGDMFKLMEEELMPEIPYIGGKPADMVARIIKMADAIESAQWISENKMGTDGEVVAKYNSRIMAELVVKFTEETKVDWFPPVNEILMDLGMPYLSNALRLTPP